MANPIAGNVDEWDLTHAHAQQSAHRWRPLPGVGIADRWSGVAIRCSAGFGGVARRGHEPQLVSGWVCDGHVPKPQVVIRRLGRDPAFILELPIPGVHVRDHKVDQAAHLTIAGVLRQEQLPTVANHGHEYWEVRLEAVLPLYAETEPFDVEDFTLLVVRNPQGCNHSLSGYRH